MLNSSLVLKTDEIITVSEDAKLKDVLDIFNQKENSSLRAIPILDKSKTLFRGNIYKQHIYKHLCEDGDMNLPVTALMRNSTKFIFTNSEFFEIFFAISDLPFIAVLDENHHFYGIFTHDSLMQILAQSWGINKSKIALAVPCDDEHGELSVLSKIVSHFCTIESAITIEDQDNKHRIIFTLPIEEDSLILEKLIKKIKRLGFETPSIENLSRFH